MPYTVSPRTTFCSRHSLDKPRSPKPLLSLGLLLLGIRNLRCGVFLGLCRGLLPCRRRLSRVFLGLCCRLLLGLAAAASFASSVGPSSSSSDSVRASASHFSRRRPTFAGPVSSSTRRGAASSSSKPSSESTPNIVLDAPAACDFLFSIYAHVRSNTESLPLYGSRTALRRNVTAQESAPGPSSNR